VLSVLSKSGFWMCPGRNSAGWQPALPNLLGQNTTLRTGISVTTPDTEVLRFGDFSLVAVDPAVPGGRYGLGGSLAAVEHLPQAFARTVA
jgi:hypothetical protein